MAKPPPPRRLFGCPFCGQAITGSEDRCRRCGGTFSDSTRFECPFCSEFVSPRETRCPSCGIDFTEFLVKTLEQTDQSDVDRLLEELGVLSAHADGPRPSDGAVCPFCGTEVTGVEPSCPNCRVSFLAGMFVQCPTCGAKMRGDALDCPVCATHFSKPLEIEREGRVERIDLERLPLAEKELETYGLREQKEVVVTMPGQRIFKPQYKVSREEERERESLREELPVKELSLPAPGMQPQPALAKYRRLAERRQPAPSGGLPPAPSGTPAVVRVRNLERVLSRPLQAPGGSGGGPPPAKANVPAGRPEQVQAKDASSPPAASGALKSLARLFSWPSERPRVAPNSPGDILQRTLKSAPPATTRAAAGAPPATPQAPAAPRRPMVVHLCPSCRGTIDPGAPRCPHCGVVFDVAQ